MDPALHGVNLSGWLVPEPWVTPELFAGTGAGDDGELFAALGREAYEARVLPHRRTFVTEEDFAAMEARGFDAVRIQVPWYLFSEGGEEPPGCAEDLERALGWAAAHGISVVVDLASLPGCSHTPDGLSLVVEDSPDLRRLALEVVGTVAERWGGRTALLGIEPLDRILLRRLSGFPPRWTAGSDASFLRNYYREAHDVVREIAGAQPTLVLAASGRLDAWRGFMGHARYENVWLDVHLYHHTDELPGVGPTGGRYLASLSRRTLERARASRLPVMVGEWSAAMPMGGSTLTPEGQLALTRVYVSAQIDAFEGAPAWFFRTWKTSWRDPFWDARVALSSFDRDMLS